MSTPLPPRSRPFRVYVDTSVIGGCLDPEFATDSLRVVEAARSGLVILLVNEVVSYELAGAPSAVQSIIPSLPSSAMEVVPLSSEVLNLRDAYLAAGIVSPRSAYDATHVAAATVAEADAIVSWNFRFPDEELDFVINYDIKYRMRRGGRGGRDKE
jgi:hypothetical protein